jgi:hypothetical protein
MVSIHAYRRELAALDELLTLVGPHAAELDLMPFGPRRDWPTLDALSPQERARAIEIFKRYRESTIEVFLRRHDPEFKQLSEQHAATFVPPLLDLFGGDRGAMMRFTMNIQSTLEQPSRLTIVLRALVTAAVASFESLITSIMADYFRLYPGALGDTQIRVKELQRFASIEEAMSDAAMRKAEDLLRVNFDEQAAWFLRELKVDWERLSIDWQVTREVFERRHTIVHHDGRVSRQYLERLGLDSSHLPLGAEIPIDEDYVRESLDELYALGVLVGHYSWVALLPTQRLYALDQLLLFDEWDRAHEERWKLLHKICSAALDLDRDLSYPRRFAFQRSKWLAQKHVQGAESIRSEVEAWAPDEALLLVGRLFLLDRRDEAVDLFLKLAEEGKIDPVIEYDMPLLRELKSHPKYLAFVEALHR